ncbi:cytochrome bc1 complex diheme cytochrome c subunit [Nocardioides limicola]|uniref:cytochrome bc1 complex diheme cytochrome c subunit n=1 Tax=Nocardioides limicola TaxID=2803368 RepID=UPI0027DB765D|nr:cytochrome c [Nocardioides sp. DJM-14]
MRLLNRFAGRLSRNRRGSVAGLLVMVLGLLITGTTYAALTPAQAELRSHTDTELIQEGRELFLVGCAFCHGQNGEGVLTADGERALGPALAGVGAGAVDFYLSTGRMPLQAPGQQSPRKAPAYTPSEIDALSAYIATLGPGPGVPAHGDYSTDGLTDDEKQEAILRGGQFFLTNCTACHNFDGSGGAMPWGKKAPTLKGVEPRHVYAAMLVGPGEMPVFSNDVLRPEDKRDIIAYLESIHDGPKYGGVFALGGLGPVSEGLFAWLVGIGACVGFAIWIAAHTTRSSKKKGSEA